MDYDLRKEEDVKEYLEKLGIEYRFTCFSEKKPDGCHLLGDYLETIKKDYVKAAKVFRNNCDEYKFAKSCSKYGNFCYLGKGVKQNSADALSYYEKGCAGGESKACTSGGLMLFSDRAKTKLDNVGNLHEKARYLLDQGCSMNDDFACYYLSGIFIQGKDNVIQKDMKEAFRYTKRSCELGNIYACANLSQMYKKGDGIDKDETKSEFYKTKALDMQNEYKESISFQRKS